MNSKVNHSRVVEQPSWSSPSASPSPPPPPVPPPVAARWARTEQNSADSCPHCRGRLASLPTRTTSLSSYSGCKGTEVTLTIEISGVYYIKASFPRALYQLLSLSSCLLPKGYSFLLS
ncbi:hypothetical protein TcasGA2_TC006426 [Tribolium castaneum]|uniref:Uncharacterized protein n=1 Tax=Tribolium castaneum TaxID=7070 RepID=D6WWR8_TRICA|nr:hypothetical protein TcasGA2_TC006426 [Tribolium castaneum]